MEPTFSAESALDVSSIIAGGYPTVGAPATVQQSAPAATDPPATDPPAGGEKPKEESQAATEGAGAPTTDPPAESAKRTDYAAMDAAQLRQEIARRDREILSSEYGVLNLKTTHKEQMAGLQNAATFLELASKDAEPEKAIDHMVGLIAQTAGTTKEALYAKLGVKGADAGTVSTETPAAGFQFVKDAEGREFFDGDDRQFVQGIVGAVMSQVRQALQEVKQSAPHDPVLKSLLEREQEAQKQAEVRKAAEENAELVQKAAALTYHGLELSREEAVAAAEYRLGKPHLSIEDAVFLVHKEKVKDRVFGSKRTATGPEELPRGANEHVHGNPPHTNGKPGSAEVAEIFAGYPTL